MVTVKEIMDVEKSLLELDSKYRYTYSFDELVRSERYIKEIGEITDIFFSVQNDYKHTLNNNDDDFEQKLIAYNNKLLTDEINIDLAPYLDFINHIKEKTTNGE